MLEETFHWLCGKQELSLLGSQPWCKSESILKLKSLSKKDATKPCIGT